LKLKDLPELTKKPDSADLQSVPNIIIKKKYLTAFSQGDIIQRKPMLRHFVPWSIFCFCAFADLRSQPQRKGLPAAIPRE
jgi:hypothetical protein